MLKEVVECGHSPGFCDGQLLGNPGLSEWKAYYEDQRKQLQYALLKAVELLDYYGPVSPAGHMCSPNSCCDNECAELYHFNSQLFEWRALATR
jgi:hypothetical protein